MLPDFADAWASYIGDDGIFKLPISIQLGGPSTAAADPDGLVLTFCVFTPEGGVCLLSLLCRMAQSDAVKLVLLTKNGGVSCPTLLPKVGAVVCLTKRIDSVVGASGERYSRFAWSY